MELRNKQNTQKFEFLNLNPKVMLTAIIPKVRTIFFKIYVY